MLVGVSGFEIELLLQVGPAVGVGDGCKSSLLPQERTILGQETAERTAARTSVQPCNG